MSSSSSRIYGLDIVRAYAILAVLVAHARIVGGNMLDQLAIPFIPWIDGVEMFFVLSGYLIGQIIMKTLADLERPTMGSLVHFWKRRWLRTLPNYYLILGVNLLFAYFAVLPIKVSNFSWHFLFFIHNFWVANFNFFWESWSLSIEEWFYLIFPLLLWGLVVIVKKNRQQVILGVIITMLLAPLLYRINLSDTPVGGFYDWDIYFRKPVITRLDAVMYGVLAAYLKCYHHHFWTKYSNFFFLLGLGICLFNIYLPKDLGSFYAKTFSFCVTSLGAALLLSKADRVKNPRFPTLGRVITHISKISYSLYLTNLLVAQLLAVYFPLETLLQQAIAYGLFWVASILISTLLYYGFEKPILKWRDS